jgi:hypothetical protein
MKRYVDNTFKAQIPVAELTVSLLLINYMGTKL